MTLVVSMTFEMTEPSKIVSLFAGVQILAVILIHMNIVVRCRSF